MIALAGVYVLWRVLRGLVPLLVVAGVVIVLLAPGRQLPPAARQLRHDVSLQLRRAQQTVSRAISTELQG